MKYIQLAFFVALVYLSQSVSADQGQNMQQMKHANPMPNLMKVIKRHGDQLNLTTEQNKELAAWRDAHRTKSHSKVSQVNSLEKELFDAAMAGKSKAELMEMASKMLQLRREMIAGKIDCRDNMRRILNDEQYAKVLELYTKL